ncbi:MAG: FtsX-like permease family protein [Mucilaginibacter sp.]|nr:FtsX-like permease family protein [Mucilaginibacter sp.]
MNAYAFHISFYDLAFLGTIFIGLAFTLQLCFTKRINQAANRFLALALSTIVLWMVWVLGIDIQLGTYFPSWSWLPLQFSLTFGPLIYFYVLKITRPEYKFRRKDLLHFSPLLLQQGVLVLEIKESIRMGAATYDTLTFQLMNPVLHVAAFISVITYLYWSFRLIERFYRRLKFNNVSDRPRYELRWLHRLLTGFGLLWLLWIPYTAVDYFYYHDQLGIHAYYPLYLLLAIMMIRIAAAAFLKPEIVQVQAPPVSKLLPPASLKQKGIWLKKAVEVNLLYQDAELSLGSLAEKLNMHPHELSRIINVAFKKNLNDFINEYRIREVTQKMQDPAYDRLTLLGIAFDCGFNSKSTFNRTFRQMTGKSPVEYKNHLKKERPSYHLTPYSHSTAVISYHETTPRWSDEKLNRNYMFRNYLRIAWRNIIKNKAHSFINISGLAVGIACSLLILLWVQNELDMDAWHKNGPRIYAVYQRSHVDHKDQAGYGTPAHMADEMKKVIPDVLYATQLDWGDQNTFQVGEKILKLNGFFAGADYFKMFDSPLLQGSAQAALSTPASIAISHKMANQFYGSAQAAIGKSIRFENKKNFTVSAVFEDLPKTSSQKFDFLINWQEFLDENGWAQDWSNAGPRTFIMLRADANAALVEKKITHFLDAYDKNQKKGVRTIDLGLQPYNKIYLHGNFTGDKIDGGRIEYVNLFSMVAVFILLIACINFMNLSTARSVKRAREIGVRKVIGAVRSVLIKQFIGESMMVTVIAVAFSLLLLVLLLPAFNQVTQKQIDLPFAEPAFWTRLLVITLVTGLVSGSYPALFLSSFNPVKVLKGTLKLGSGVTLFRKGLVVFQFSLSITLIISTIIISKQVNFIQTKNLGYDRENLIYMPLDGDLATKYDILKSEVLKQPGIQSITRINANLTNIENGTSGVDWTGKNPDDQIQFTQASVGYDFVNTMKLKMLAGRDYSKDFKTDSVGYLINEAALNRIGYKDPIGKPLTFWGKKGTIIGLIKDFHFNSLHEQIKPLVIRFGEKDPYGNVMVRTLPGQTKQALASLESICKKLNPSFPFNYTFSDEEYKNLYQNEQVVGKLSNAFAFLGIFISCLGLLGLAMFTAEQRFKEIGIRKVLGASVASLFVSLSREFVVLVVIALLIATPLSYLAMTKWLENYQYKTDISLWVFALSALIAIIITLMTISLQTVKAALVNPVKCLRSE